MSPGSILRVPSLNIDLYVDQGKTIGCNVHTDVGIARSCCTCRAQGLCGPRKQTTGRIEDNIGLVSNFEEQTCPDLVTIEIYKPYI